MITKSILRSYETVLDRCSGITVKKFNKNSFWQLNTKYKRKFFLRKLHIYKKIIGVWVYNTHFINNIFTDSSYQLDVDGNNRLLGNVYLPLEKIFQNYDKSEIDRYKHDFHLKTEAKQKIKGTDGTDEGIYGTREPFKEYGLPVNPQI